MVEMFSKEGEVGPKGQVVIPKDFREEMNIFPGSKVEFECTEKGILIRKEDEKIEKVFEEVAKSGKRVSIDFHPHEAYESEMEDRN